jgi:uncharacterized membrane protein YfcA
VTERLLVWAGLALAVHTPWELAQLPLYALWQNPDALHIASHLIKTLLGDVLIATGFYLVAGLVYGDMDWPPRHARRGAWLLAAVGFVFAACREGYHVYLADAWTYAPAMPLAFGIGITPLLQWLLLSPLMVIIVRHLR